MPESFKSRPFYYRLVGKRALFTAPETKGGGEKMSYSVPTYSALKGITKSIYWKPSIRIVIDEVKIVNPIVTESMGVRALMGSGSKMSTDINLYTYLKDVEYLVKFHFEWNIYQPHLRKDWNKKKHESIMQRSIDRGGRLSVFIGTSECMGFVSPVSVEEYEDAETFYDGQALNLGIMFHSFTYPNEAYSKETENKLTANYTGLQMIDGVVVFPRSEACEIKQVIQKDEPVLFGDIKSVEDEYKEVFGE